MRGQSLYRLMEAVFGRRLLWRAGRFLYQGARRELGGGGDASDRALIGWIADSWRDGDPRPVLMDIGANHGLWSRPLAEGFAGRDGTLYAFEPAPAQRSRLCRELLPVEGIDIQVRAEAVGANPGKGRFEVTGEATGSSGLLPDGAAPVAEIIDVDITTIDQLMAELAIDHLTFAKVDTEGNDFNVLAGATQAFADNRVGALLFEYNTSWLAFGHSLRQVFDLLAGSGYVLGKLTPAGVEVFTAWHFELDRFMQCDWLVMSPEMCRRLPCRSFQFDSSNVAVEVG